MPNGDPVAQRVSRTPEIVGDALPPARAVFRSAHGWRAAVPLVSTRGFNRTQPWKTPGGNRGI